jgi:hypothetical protein
MTFEYTTVALEHGPAKTREQEWTDLLNRVSEHGWRLVSVSRGYGETQYAFFERESTND